MHAGLQIMRTISDLKLDGGCPAFDFTNTISNRNTLIFHDYLATYDDYLQWCKKVALLPNTELKEIVAYANTHSKATLDMHNNAIETREMLFELFSDIINRRKAREDVLTKFNAMLSHTLSHLKLEIVGREIKTSLFKRDSLLEVPVFLLIKNAFDLLTAADPSRMKECPNCGWLFLDKTKNGKRRWCNMQVCGARDKSHRYYERQKSTET
jgi:predicted RNA-binding Zn ribbon-like protein